MENKDVIKELAMQMLDAIDDEEAGEETCEECGMAMGECECEDDEKEKVDTTKDEPSLADGLVPTDMKNSVVENVKKNMEDNGKDGKDINVLAGIPIPKDKSKVIITFE